MLILALTAAWLVTTAQADGDDVLTYQMTFGQSANGDVGVPGEPGHFIHPFGVAIDSMGRFLVSDVYEDGDADSDPYENEVSNRIHIFSADGTYQTSFGETGSELGQLSYPTGLAVDSLDQIVVTDNDNNRIQVFSSTGQPLQQFGTYGNYDPLQEGSDPIPPGMTHPPADHLNWPTGVAVKPGTRLLDSSDSLGRVAIVDATNHRVVVLTANLQPVMSIGGHTGEDSPVGTFEYPWGVAIDSQGRFYVSDTDNNRVQVFDANGNFLWLFGTAAGSTGTGDLSRPQGIALDAAGRLLVGDSDRSRLLRVDITRDITNDTELRAALPGCDILDRPRCQLATSHGKIYAALVLDRPAPGMHPFAFAKGGIATDSLMGSMATGRVAFADTDHNIVQVFQAARLEILNATAAPASGARVGEPVSLTFTVANSGQSALNVTPIVTASLEGDLPAISAQMIAPGAQYTYNLEFTPEETGDLEFTIGADGTHVSGTVVSATNVKTASIPVGAALGPSLTTPVGVNATVVGIGETITVSVTLVNAGNKSFTFSTSVSPSPSGAPVQPIEADPITGTSVKETSQTLTFTYSAQAEGTVSFIATTTATYKDDSGQDQDYPVEPETSPTVTIKSDVVAPTTTATVSFAPDGTNGWYKTAPTVTLTAEDNEGGSGVSRITCTVAGAGSTRSCLTHSSSTSVLVDNEGTTQITFAAVDRMGNVESTQTLFFKLDTVAPIIRSVSISPTANAAGWHNTDVVVGQTVQIEEETSGVAFVSPAVTVTEEGIEGPAQTVTVTARDGAGNVATKVIKLKIDKTAPVFVACSTQSGGYVWPPNHKWVPWVTTVSVTDAIDNTVLPNAFKLVAATSNEDSIVIGDGSTSNDIRYFAIGTADTAGEIRAERSGTAGGRIYSLVYTSTDVAGNIGTCTVITSEVPHAQGGMKKIK